MESNTMTVQTKAALYATSLVEVLPHIGRKSLDILIPKDLSEMQRMSNASADEREFVDSNVVSGKLCFMPDLEKELRSIESQARYVCKRSTLVQNYVLFDMYEEIATKFDELKAKYFAKRDEISKEWDTLLISFSNGLMAYVKSCLNYGSLESMEPELAASTKKALDKSAEELHKSLMSQIPSKEEWMNSFRFTLEVREYPAAPGSLPGMDKKWEERTEELAKSLLANQVESMFDGLNRLFQAIQGERSLTSSTSNVVALANKALNHRIVDNDKLIQLAEDVAKFSAYADDSDQMAEHAEKAMAQLLRLADAFNISLNLSEMPVTKEYLLGA